MGSALGNQPVNEGIRIRERENLNSDALARGFGQSHRKLWFWNGPRVILNRGKGQVFGYPCRLAFRCGLSLGRGRLFSEAAVWCRVVPKEALNCEPGSCANGCLLLAESSALR